MSLRYALLALLTAKPWTGYEAYQYFENSVGYVWHAPDSQIYPELQRMETAGLVHGTPEKGKRGSRRRYSITESGERAFRAWIAAADEYPRERDTPHLRAAYLEWVDRDDAIAHFRRHVDYHARRIDQWQTLIMTLRDGSNPILTARLAGKDANDRKRILDFKVLAYEGMIRRAEAEVAWARQGVSMVEGMDEWTPQVSDVYTSTESAT